MAVRKQHQEQHLLQWRAMTGPPPSTSTGYSTAADEIRTESDDSLANSNTSSFAAAGNLDRFLEFTTPVVPARCHRQRSLWGWGRLENVESCRYFDLRDLWEFYEEWSAFGAGVPLVLNGNGAVVQYYKPFLSGIELYADSSRQPVEESDDEAYQDMNSESSRGSDICATEEGTSGDDRDGRNRAIGLVYDYMERAEPCDRLPLADKISLLATQKCPGLKTYKSCDLLSSSWMCIAWYPIYPIPTCYMMKDLDARFLTFHLLSTPSNKSTSNGTLCNGSSSSIKSINSNCHVSSKISVSAFGLASYNPKGSVWTSNGKHEQQQAKSLLQAADGWLSLLGVQHPDSQFFRSGYKTR